MNEKNKTPQYAVRLVIVLVSAGVIFFGGLQLFVPEGSKLTGSYDAASLRYIASDPLTFRGSQSCGNTSCHEELYKAWSTGAHGAREEKSKCEVCHGPQRRHPEQGAKLLKVRGDGNLVELCLSCHRKLKARSTTGQPQVIPQDHPMPHEGVLLCTNCHDPHSPGFGKEASEKIDSTTTADGNTDQTQQSPGATLAENCFTCHRPSGRGGIAPVLAGQSYEVLKDKLSKFKSGEINSPMMNPIVSPMDEKSLDALARYFAGLS